MELFQKLQYVLLNNSGKIVMVGGDGGSRGHNRLIVGGMYTVINGCTSLCWRNLALCQTPAGRMHGHGTGPRKGYC